MDIYILFLKTGMVKKTYSGPFKQATFSIH